jgi:hypothetical protein
LVAVLGICSLIALPDAPRLIAFEDVAQVPVVSVASTAEIASRSPQAAVIPAALRKTEIPLKVAAMPKSVPAASIYRPAKFGEARSVKPRQGEARPMMVRANAEHEIAAPQLLFIMQTTQYDESGSAILKLCVWRVTFDNENRETVRQEVIVRSL